MVQLLSDQSSVPLGSSFLDRRILAKIVSNHAGLMLECSHVAFFRSGPCWYCKPLFAESAEARSPFPHTACCPSQHAVFFRCYGQVGCALLPTLMHFPSRIDPTSFARSRPHDVRRTLTQHSKTPDRSFGGRCGTPMLCAVGDRAYCFCE